MATGKRAVIYTRISKDSEARGEGIDRQLIVCRNLAKRLGLEVVNVFPDNDSGASTASTSSRPQYDRMIAGAWAKQFDVILSYSFSRLTRRVSQFLELIELHQATGVLIKTDVSGEPDLNTADGRAVALTLATWDQAEAERTAERVRIAIAQRAQKGHYTGPRPFGYQFLTDEKGNVLSGYDRSLVIDPSEALVIKEAVRRVLNGESLWSIAKDFNDRGITTSTGSPWQSQPLRRMLMRWVHAGYRKHQEYKLRKWVGQEQLYEGSWEAIIDRETHERVIAKLTAPERVANRGDTSLKYLLTWLATCGACSRPLVGAKEYTYPVKGYKRKDGTRGPDRIRTFAAKYTCPHANCHKVGRSMKTVDEFVERVIVGILKSADVHVYAGDQAAIDEAQASLDSAKAKLDLYSDMWREGQITDDQFRRQNPELMKVAENAERRLRGLQPVNELTEYVGATAEVAWAASDVIAKRTVIKALMETLDLRIVVNPIGTGALSVRDHNPYQGIEVTAGRTNHSNEA